MASHTITALFKTRPEAQTAVEALQRDIGLTSVRILADTDMSGATASGASSVAPEDRGFFASLRDLFVPEEEHHTYEEGIRRGGVLVTASVEESQATRVMDLLEQHGAVDLDAEERRWKDAGWTGASKTTAASGMAAATGISATTGTTATTGVAARVPPTTATTTGLAAGRATTDDGAQSIALMEERLVVGKRDVSHGRVKIRSYVVETPVSERVSLRDERVTIERRPVDRALAPGEDAFTERTIEATETDEEAVISKQARVREELVLRKDVEVRDETVTDKVRRTEVEIEGDHAAAKGQTSTTQTTTTTQRPATASPTAPLPTKPLPTSRP